MNRDMGSDEEVQRNGGDDGPRVLKINNPSPLSSSQRGLISNENSENDSNLVLSPFSKRLNFLKFGKLDSASAKFQRIAVEKDEFSRTVPSSTSQRIRERFQRMFSRKIDWTSLWKISKEWIRNPMNLALFIWILCVAVSGAILFMVMTGMLNHVLPLKSERDAWFEVNNQILNALFTLMCLYQQPKRAYNFVLLLKWRPEDVLKLRKIYCKNETYKPHEWAHMMVIVLLLNINCFAQYALCGLNLGYKRSNRPAIGVGICVSVAIGAPAFAGIYSMLSPLGRDYVVEEDEESQVPIDNLRRKSLEKRYSFALGDEERSMETKPSWSGGVFDFWDDISLAYLSLFCTFCIFGWNMERLGLGNMYVHIATFLLFCMAPFWIFNLAAININNETVREALGVTGIVLCVFGLLYGGFWRIQMRKRFNLPAYKFCCGKAAITDCSLWLFCCWCSLAQEVRTGNAYNIVEDKFYRKKKELSPLPREDGELHLSDHESSPWRNLPQHSTVKSNSPSPSRFYHEYRSSAANDLSLIEPESHAEGRYKTMAAPIPSVIRR